jgi:probable phosphoglycerate mutase
MEVKPLATRVILVRHGESTYNVERRFQGHGDVSTLTAKGLATARQVGEVLKGIPFAGIYNSPLQRASQTAQEIYASLQTDGVNLPSPKIVPDLIEICLPAWEGMRFEDVRQTDPAEYAHWQSQPHLLKMAVPDSSEPFFPVRTLYEQSQRVWQQILPHHTDQTILLIAHSGINRALLCTALGLGPESYLVLQQANCGISVLNFPQGWGFPAQLESMNLTSHLGHPFPPPRNGQQTLRLLLVRHGETDWNRQGRFQGQIDVPLNPTGQQQGEQVAEFLRSLPIEFAISSPMLRPKDTAERILQHHPQVELQLLPDLQEISHGTWEGKLEPEVEQEYPGELQRWRDTPAQVQMPAGENLQQVWQRAIAAWSGIVATAKANSNQPKLGLVVAHDAINKVILCHVTGLEAEQFWNFKQGNGAVSVIDYPLQGGAPVLQAMNITTHLSGSIFDRTAAGAL